MSDGLMGLDLFDGKPYVPPKEKIPKTKNPFDVESILDEVQGGISSQESRGRTTAVNPRTQATGEFQVLPENIPAWTKKHLNQTLTPEQFKANPEAQRKVFRGEFGEYLGEAFKRTSDKDTAIRMAAAAWYGGKGAMKRYDNPNRFRPNEPSFREYTNSVLSKIKKQPSPIDLFGDVSFDAAPIDLFSDEPIQTQTVINSPVPTVDDLARQKKPFVEGSIMPQVPQTVAQPPVQTQTLPQIQTLGEVPQIDESFQINPFNKDHLYLNDTDRQFNTYLSSLGKREATNEDVANFNEIQKLSVNNANKANQSRELRVESQPVQNLSQINSTLPYRELPNESTKQAVVKNDDDILKTQAGKVGVDLSQKPKGMSVKEFFDRSSLKALQSRYGYTDAQIEAYVKSGKSNWNKLDYYSGLSDAELQKHKGELVPLSVDRGVIADVTGDFEKVKKDYEQQQEEADLRLASQQNPLEVGQTTDDLQRSFAEDDYRQQLAKERDLREKGIDVDLYKQAEEYVRNSPTSAGTQADIEKQYQLLKDAQLSDETQKIISATGKSTKIGDYFGGSSDFTSGLLSEAGQTVGDYGAGIVRPLANLSQGTFLGLPLEKLYIDLQKLSNGAKIYETSAKTDNLAGDVVQFGGKATFDVPKYMALSALPGGAVVGFGVDAGLRASGQGKNPLEIGKDTAKGLLLGGLFKGASKLSGLAEKGLLNTFKQGEIPSPDVALASKIFGTTTRLGTIGVGTYNLERGFGADHESAFKSAVVMTLFDLAMNAKDFGTIKDLTGKVFRMSNSKTGETANVTVESDGSVKLLKGSVPPEAVDAEFDLANVKEAKLNKDGVYEVESDTSPVRQKEVKQPLKSLETSPEPNQLAEKNPLRIDKAESKAVEKLSTDKRAQKIAEILSDGKTQSIESLAKQTKYSEANISNAIDTLYGARQIEILPDNTIRKISSEEIVKPKPTNLYEKYNQNIDETPTEVSKPSVQMDAKPLVSDQQTQSDVSQPVEKSIEDVTKAKYESLPQQKEQKKQEEKPVAKISYAERPNLAEKLNVFTERGTKAAIEPQVIEADDLLTSLDEGYPQKFQPRDRSRTASKAQISEIANKLNPEFLGDSPKASDGRPLVVPVEMPDGKTKYAVISGNGRTAGIRQAYDLENEGSKAYKEFVKAKGGEGLSKPVYVGILDPDQIQNFSEFAKESNESATALMSASEQAKSDADRIDASVLNLFVPSDDGTIHGAANRDFVRAFLDKTTSTSERNRFIDAEGRLNQEGVTRVKNAIFAKAFSSSEMGMATLARMSESTDSNIKNITNALLAKAGELSSFAEATKDQRRFKELDIAPDFARAMEKYSELKESGTSIDEYIQQGNLFGANTSPLQTRVMQVFDFYKRRSKSIKAIIDNYIQAAEAIGDPKQQGLFGETEIPSKESIFEGAVRSYEQTDTGETEAEEVSLFDQDQGRKDQLAARSESDVVTAKVEEKLSSTAKAELRRTGTPEELQKAGIKPLGEKGKFGQTSHILRKAMMASDSTLTTDLASVFAPDTDLNSPHSHDAILDAISTLAGKDRSSQLSPSDWQKVLETNADKMTDSSIDTILSALRHQDAFFADRSAFAQSKELSDILSKTEGLYEIKEYRELPLATRKQILAIGRKYAKLSDNEIKNAFNETLGDFQELIRKEPGQEPVKTDAGEIESKGEAEPKEKTESETRGRLSDESGIKQAISVSLSELDTPAEKKLYRDVNIIFRRKFSDGKLLQLAVSDIKNGDLYANSYVVEFLRRVFVADGDLISDSPLFGAYLEPHHIENAARFMKTNPFKLKGRLKTKADALINNLVKSGENDFSDSVLLVNSVGVPDGFKVARQEEFGHRADFRTRNFKSMNAQRFLANPTVNEVKSTVEDEGYTGLSDDDISAEIVAKSVRDDAKQILKTDDNGLGEIWSQYVDEIFDLGLSAADVEKHFSGISEGSEKLIEYANIRGNDVEQDSTKGQTEISSDNEGRRKISDSKTKSLSQDQYASERNAVDLEGFQRRSVLERTGNTDEAKPNSSLIKRSKIHLATIPKTEKAEVPKTSIAKRLFNQLYEKRGEDATPKKEVIVNFRRAGLLTSPKTHLRNILSNTAFQVTEEAMRPIALLADLTASAVTGKRTVQAPSVPGVLKGFKALVSDKTLSALDQKSGVATAWSILRNGDAKELEKNQLSEMKSGSPLLDKFVNYTFRALGASDALYKTYALRRSLEEQAKTIAITKSREMTFNGFNTRRKWIAAQREHLLTHPTKEMLLEGMLYADFTTFTNNNPISDWFKKVKDLSPAGKAIIEIAVPYDKTPTNIVMRTLEYSPVGFGMAGKHLIDWQKGDSYTLRNIRKGFEENWQAMDEGRKATQGLLASKTLNLLKGSNQIEDELDRLINQKPTAEEQRQYEKRLEVYNERVIKLKKELSKLEDIENRTPDQSARMVKIQAIIANKPKLEKKPLTEATYKRINQLKKQFENQQKKVEAYQKIAARQPIKNKFREEDRKAIEKALDEIFPRLQQQAFARSFGRAGLGTAALALGIYLAMKGLLSGVWDAGERDEKKEHYKRQDEGIQDGSLQIGDRRYQILDNPLGKTMVAGASIWERSQMKLDKDESRIGKLFNDTTDVTGGIIKQQPLLNSLDDYFGSDKTIEQRVAGILGSFVPSILADTADVLDSEKRETKSLLDSGANRIPLLREELPKAKYDREKYLQRRSNRLINKFDPFNSRPVQ